MLFSLKHSAWCLVIVGNCLAVMAGEYWSGELQRLEL